jgi:hypothetical protein
MADIRMQWVGRQIRKDAREFKTEPKYRRADRKMAGAAGLEPATYGFGDRRSTN